MRILLAHNSTYYPALGGGDKSNRILMERLAQRGHECRVMGRTEQVGHDQEEALAADLTRRGIAPLRRENGAVIFRLDNVEVHTAANVQNVRAYFAHLIDELRPDVIITSTDDPAHLLLDVALRSEARVVYLVRATIAAPFGPDSAFPSEVKTEALRHVDGVVGVSHYVARYVRQWSGIDAIHVPISLQDPEPHPELGRFDNEFITLVNPCAVKGIAIFIGLAKACPDLRFAAVPTWGTNEDDLKALRRLPNVELIQPVDDIDDLLRRTRVMLVPSVWAEARSRMVVESMLRGVPVMAADVGGLSEAMMGLDYLLPVRPVERYHARVDRNMVPVAEVPPQDIEPWVAALRRLTSDPNLWKDLAVRSRATAQDYVAHATVESFEKFLFETISRPKKTPTVHPNTHPPQLKALDRLSPERRRLLALMVKHRTHHAHGVSASTWFPFVAFGGDVKLRLFCFPYAGAGAAAYRPWIAPLSPEIAVCPARLPGRETRLSEPPYTEMAELVRAVENAIAPFLDTPFAFYGHSMGALIAFELARALRKEGRPMPACLIASGARAPQFRLNHVPPPEPSELDFIDELRAREGTPKEILENQEVLRLVLPALRADAALYRNYVYVMGRPLEIPIVAFGGDSDRNVSEEHVAAWREQTSHDFQYQMCPGGHFFIQDSRFADTLLAGLKSVIS